MIQRDTPPSYLLKAGLVNVQSVRNKIDHIIEAIISHDLDLLILTETWLTTDDKDQFFIRALNIKGYKFYSFPRGNNTGHGGVGIIIRSSINIKSASQCDSTNFENCFFTLDLKQQRVDLCAVYRPPPSDKSKFTVNKFIDKFGDLLQSYASNSSPVAFLGDFNFHLDKEVMQMQIGLPSLLHSLDFEQHVSSPTHRSGHTLDAIISLSGYGLVSNVHVGDLFSDYSLILCSLSHTKIPRPRKTVSIC